MKIPRRTFLAGSAGAASASSQPKRYRAAVIGHTGRGNYGHDLDTAFKGIPEIEICAIADPDDAGRAKAQARSGAGRPYSDYREMLRKEKPELVAICPRWLDQRLEMVTAAAQARAHILMEKPFAQDLEEADGMVAAAEKHQVKIQVMHVARIAPVTRIVERMLREGAIGELLEIRARGKEDKRAGGEDLMVLGTHCLDLMRYFAGDPRWVFGSVVGEAPKPGEFLGPVAGNDIGAELRFERGRHGYFASRHSGDTSGQRFGVWLCGSQGAIYVPLSSAPNYEAWITRSPMWAGSWEKFEAPPGEAIKTRAEVNTLMARDLVEAIQHSREPVCGARDARWAIEMVMGIYESNRLGRRVSFPLVSRRHPLT